MKTLAAIIKTDQSNVRRRTNCKNCNNFINENIYKTILVLIAFAYPTWAIGQFFDRAKIGSYIKALLAYIFGYLLFQIAIIVVGLTTDLIIKILGFENENNRR